MKSKVLRVIRKILVALGIVFIIMVVGLFIYSRNPYTALTEMDDQIALLETSEVAVEEDLNDIKFIVNNPKKNIIFVPGGLVTPDSYSYLAMKLAMEGYNVTIIKPIFHLAILSPNQGKRYVDDSLDNVIIGHSLGGVVSSLVAANNEAISQVILLGSYPIKDISNQEVLIISAEFDLGMDEEAFDNSLQYVSSNTVLIDIAGGNHAQFGWYGPQKGDGEATITTLQQQDLVIDYIIDFIQ